MIIYVLPVSGGGFPAQLGLLKELFKATKTTDKSGIRPDIVFASSGGNVASYIAMMGNWSDTGISKNCKLIDASLFVESWTPPFFPTWIAFPLTKSVYRNGEGVKRLFEQVFTTNSIQTTEIWTGTYNATRQQAAMFCNRSLETALIKDFGEDSYIYDMEASRYLNGNLLEIGKSCYASASIPYLTPGIVIGTDRYVDGGSMYASPLAAMSPRLTETLSSRKRDEPIQIHYFCSYDMNAKFTDSFYSTTVGLLIHSSLIQDRIFAVNLLKQYGKVRPVPLIYRNLNSKQLREVMNSLKLKSYVMAFFPKDSPSVSVTSFSSKSLEKAVALVENHVSMFVWVMEYRY